MTSKSHKCLRGRNTKNYIGTENLVLLITKLNKTNKILELGNWEDRVPVYKLGTLYL